MGRNSEKYAGWVKQTELRDNPTFRYFWGLGTHMFSFNVGTDPILVL